MGDDAAGSELGAYGCLIPSEAARAAVARQWQEESAELSNWAPDQVHRLVEDLATALAAIAANGQVPYLRVSV